MKLKNLADTFLISNALSIEEAEEFDRHVLHHQYYLHWWSWRVWQTRAWSHILPPLNKLKSLADTFLITSTPCMEEAVQFDRHILDHQSSLHWRNWWVWQTPSWSPINPPFMKLEGFTDTFFITNTPSIEGAEEIERQNLDHQHSLHWRSWRVWQTRSWSPILPPIRNLKSLTDTFLITNIPYIEGANEFERHVLDHQYTLLLWSWRVWQTRSSSPILPPLMKLKSLTDTFLITNTPSIRGTNEFERHVLLTSTPSIEEAVQFDRHILDHHYSLHWRS